MKTFSSLIVTLILSTSLSWGQYDSLTFDWESFETARVEFLPDSIDALSDLRFTLEERKYSLEFYDFTSDSLDEAIVWWKGYSMGARVKVNHAGFVIFDIKNYQVLFDVIYNDCIEYQAAWTDPTTGEAHYLEEMSCCREVTFVNGSFVFSEIETEEGSGVKVDYPCGSVIQIEEGKYKFNGKNMEKIK